MNIFKYGETELEDGIYIVQVDWMLHIAEHNRGDWAQMGIDYDVWQFSQDPPESILVLCRIDVAATVAGLPK